MDATFWHQRWSEGRIGFHEGQVNAHLKKHEAVLPAGSTVFVPLCGKAEDLAWLAGRGHRVVGVELVESAVQAFFAEHALSPTVTSAGELKRYEAQGITLFAGDVFAVGAAQLVGATALYDRAALIALPPALRERYARHVSALMPKGAAGLLVAVEYPVGTLEGPPFSVPEAEVRQLYEVSALLDDVVAVGPRFVGGGARERCFQLRF